MNAVLENPKERKSGRVHCLYFLFVYRIFLNWVFSFHSSHSFSTPSSQKIGNMQSQKWRNLTGQATWKESKKFWRIMKLTELSLAPTQFVLEKSTNSSSSESENNPSRKRKFSSDQYLPKNGSPIQASVDLHVKDPLPLDWEQCLDLEVSISLSYIYCLFDTF